MEAKKNPKFNLEKQVVYRFQIGIVLGLSIALVAFEWSHSEYIPTSTYIVDVPPEEEQAHNYKIIKAEIPKLKKVVKDNAEIKIVKELKKEILVVKVEPKIVEPTDPKGIIEIVDEPDPWVKEETTIFTIVEEMPSFIGGEEEMYNYLGRNIKFPYLAKDAGIQGIVYVTFVIMEDGSIANARVLRGIGAGCDEEALRVIKKMPNWKPGKQRGRPVRVQFNMPINFKLKKG